MRHDPLYTPDDESWTVVFPYRPTWPDHSRRDLLLLVVAVVVIVVVAVRR